jgi:hypothetical protein
MTAYYLGYPRISENDKFCFTSWIIYHSIPLEHKEIEKYIREEIAKFGPQYDVSWREIKIKQTSVDSISITVVGSWDPPNTSDHPDLHRVIFNISGIDKVNEHFREVCA